MHTRFLRLIALALTISIGATACGGGDSEEAHVPSEIESALADYFADPANDTPISNRADADCTAKEIVALFGDDALEAMGVTASFVPELEDMGMSDEQVGWVLTGFNNCIDLTAEFPCGTVIE